MGCLPLIAALLLGAGLGYLVAGPAGALWGTAVGLLLGVLAAGALSVFLRRANHR